MKTVLPKLEKRFVDEEFGEIIISEKTYERIKNQFSMKKQGKIKLKNKRKPVIYLKVHYN